MKHSKWILAGIGVGAIAAAAGAATQMQQKGGADDTGPYKAVANDWLKPLVAGYIDRGCAVFVESANRIWYTTDVEFPVPQRRGPGAGPPGAGAAAAGARGAPQNPGAVSPDEHKPHVLILDAQGNIVENWGKQWEHLLNMPHAVRISPYDAEKNVWIIDRDNSQVFRFSHDGKKLELTMGEPGVIKSDDVHFGRPADISFAPDGSYYIADGYANTRVIKFDKSDKRTITWGTEGSGPGQFKVQVHDVAVAADGRVFVGDRGNGRISIFDANGKYLDEWDNIRGPSYLHITKDQKIWVVSGAGNRLVEYDMNGKMLTWWGEHGLGDGQFDDPHDLSVAANGDLYVTSWSLSKVGLNKFTPNPEAPKSRLIGLGFNRLPLPAKAAEGSPLSMANH